MQNRTIALIICLCLAAIGLCQEGNGSKPAWDQFKLPNKSIKLDFRNASAAMIVELFSRVSGITIVTSPDLSDRMTVMSPKAVTLSQAFAILNAALGLRGFEIEKQGNLLLIRQQGQRGNDDNDDEDEGRGSEEFMDDMMERFNQGQSVLEVYKVDYASATDVARIVNEVFGGASLEQMLRQMRGRDRGRGDDDEQVRSGPAVRASADDYSNSVIVLAPSDQQEAIATLIDQIDEPNEAPQTTVIYPLDYAYAEELVDTVDNVLLSNAPTGRGAGSDDRDSFSRRFRSFFGGGGGQSGQVVADSRSNSLIITATDENHEVVERVIAVLDQPVEIVNSTYIVPLDNTNSIQMAQLLNNTFQGTAGGGLNGGFNNQNGGRGGNFGNGNDDPFNRGGGDRGGRRGGLQSSLSDPDALALAFEDPASGGELLTQISVSNGGQFGQFQFGGQQEQIVQRDAQGRPVNSIDLSDVFVIPDPNTNSLIIVASPEDLQLIQQIIAQLDKIPEQVMIETIIVEATLDASSKFGIEWEFLQNDAFGNDNATGQGNADFGLQTNPPAEGFRYSLAGPSLDVFLNAIATDDRFQVLSTPRIFTTNNEVAEINISQQVPFVVSQREDANGNFIFNYDFQDVGIVLTVLPHITSNGMVTLEVTQTANDLQGFTDFNAPIVNQRIADTVVTVADGETIVLGGIIRSTVSSTVKKIPLLGDIPILGELFKSREERDVRTELLVLLTPRIVRNPEEAAAERERQVGELSQRSQDRLGNKSNSGGNGGGTTGGGGGGSTTGGGW